MEMLKGTFLADANCSITEGKTCQKKTKDTESYQTLRLHFSPVDHEVDGAHLVHRAEQEAVGVDRLHDLGSSIILKKNVFAKPRACFFAYFRVPLPQLHPQRVVVADALVHLEYWPGRVQRHDPVQEGLALVQAVQLVAHGAVRLAHERAHLDKYHIFFKKKFVFC